MSAFQSLKEKLLGFYQSKNESEQRLLVIFAVTVLLFGIVSVYLSVANGLADTEKKLSRQLELNSWAEQQIAIIKQSQGNGRATDNSGSMTQVINTSARRFNITLARLQPQQNNYVKVGLEDVNFNQLMQWLTQLQNTYSIRAANIDISKTETQGIVRVRRLDLERI